MEVLIEEQVCRFQVPVHVVDAPKILENGYQGHDVKHTSFVGFETFLAQEFAEVAVKRVVEHQVLAVAFSEGGVELDDAGVVDLLENALLVKDLLNSVLVLDAELLDRVHVVPLAVLHVGSEHARHRALPQLANLVQV